MKTKLLLFMLLSLFAVQGWASPVDSLGTHKPGNSINGELKGINFTSGFEKISGLDGLARVSLLMVLTHVLIQVILIQAIW